MTIVTILISISQTFRSWVEIVHLRRPLVWWFHLTAYTISRSCASYKCFIMKSRLVTNQHHKKGYIMESTKLWFRTFYGRHVVLFNNMQRPNCKMKYRNFKSYIDFQTDQNNRNFITLYLVWPISKCEIYLEVTIVSLRCVFIPKGTRILILTSCSLLELHML